MSATVTFSIEVELGWGLVQYDKLDVLSPYRRAETNALERLLKLCDELEIQITFNIVGHLLHDGRLNSYEGGHEPSRFNNIPHADSNTARLFYATDLIEQIQNATVNHEICTHTFTHVECGEVTKETLRWEFEKVLETHEEFGLERPVSLVPPRHSPPPRDILREYGIEIVRSPRVKAPGFQPPESQFHLGWDILRGSQPITPPRNVEEVVETYCTRYPVLSSPLLQSGQSQPHPLFKSIPQTVRKQLHLWNLNRNLSTAIERDSSIHEWTHLWEIANDIQWPQIKAHLRQVAGSRDEDRVTIHTMKELNSKVRSASYK